MITTRKKEIRHAILQTLERAKPYLLDSVNVRTTINFSLRPIASLSEFEDVCAQMETARQIIMQLNDDRELKLKITDEGMAALND